MMILSLNAPAIHAMPDAASATDLARRANDFLAAEVARRPDRFQAFAALLTSRPPSSSASAAAEFKLVITPESCRRGSPKLSTSFRHEGAY